MYPVPTQPPVYHPSPKVSGTHYSRSRLGRLLEQIFFLAATGLTLVLAYYLITSVTEWGWWSVLALVAVWGLGAYLTMPRLHQMLTDLYVPDYFIARTRTGDGLLGDPVNLALMGSEAQIHEAMTKAGWTKADPITLGSALGIVKSSLLRRSYPEAPVSSLFVFGNQQDFAYQQEVDGNAAQRHHVRFWRTPDDWLLPGGRRVDWVAAGTYDRSVGLSLFTGQVTHKIDANIDVERDYIINSVRYASPEVGVDVIKDFSTGYHSRNGGGDRVRTDGNLPILDVSALDAKPIPPPKRPHGLTDRPVSIAIGVVLLLLLTPLDMVFAWLTRDDYGFTPSDQDYPTFLIVLGVVMVIGALVQLALIFGTYRRVLIARVLLLASTIISAYGQMFALLAYDTAISPLYALVRVAIAIGAVYALTSRSARRWTDEKFELRALAKLAQTD